MASQPVAVRAIIDLTVALVTTDTPRADGPFRAGKHICRTGVRDCAELRRQLGSIFKTEQGWQKRGESTVGLGARLPMHMRVTRTLTLSHELTKHSRFPAPFCGHGWQPQCPEQNLNRIPLARCRAGGERVRECECERAEVTVEVDDRHRSDCVCEAHTRRAFTGHCRHESI